MWEELGTSQRFLHEITRKFVRALHCKFSAKSSKKDNFQNKPKSGTVNNRHSVYLKKAKIINESRWEVCMAFLGVNDSQMKM